MWVHGPTSCGNIVQILGPNTLLKNQVFEKTSLIFRFRTAIFEHGPWFLAGKPANRDHGPGSRVYLSKTTSASSGFGGGLDRKIRRVEIIQSIFA